MKPSEKCKKLGLKSLKEMSEITGRSTRTLQQWSEDDPVFFDIVLIGAVTVSECHRSNLHQ